MQKFIFSFVGLAVIAGSPSLYAQVNPEDNRAQLLKKFDKDGDGKLNDEEREALRLELLKQAPKDEPEEKPIRERRTQSEQERDRRRAEFDKRREEGRKEFMNKYDKNSDGELDESEREVLREEGEKRRAEFMKEWDKDGNGDLDDEERDAMRDGFRKRGEEMLAKYDKDKDGILSFEEMDKARADGEFEGVGFGFPGFGGPGFGGPGFGRPEGNRRRGDEGRRPQRPTDD